MKRWRAAFNYLTPSERRVVEHALMYYAKQGPANSWPCQLAKAMESYIKTTEWTDRSDPQSPTRQA